MYTPEERQTILERIIELSKQNTRIVSAILVGSGATGFSDIYSDIDLCIVVRDDENLLDVYHDFLNQMEKQFPIFDVSKVIDENRYLQIYLFENFLECDIGFVYLSKLRALKKEWYIIYDTSKKVNEIMIQTEPKEEVSHEKIKKGYLNLIDSCWYNMMHAIISVNRGFFYRALFEINDLRTKIIELHGLRHQIVVKRYRNLHQGEPAFLNRLKQTFELNLEKEFLLQVIKQLISLFFEEASQIDQLLEIDHSKKYHDKMNQFLN